MLAGRDLKAGGTWLGVDQRGRFAAVTNYRQGQQERPAPRSRGRLVSDFLTTDTGAHEYIEQVRSDAGLYSSFNLIAFVAALTGGTSDPTANLFAVLADRHRADDDRLLIERTFGRGGEPGPEARFQFRADVDVRLPQR